MRDSILSLQRKALAADNRRQSVHLFEVARSAWPPVQHPPGLTRVWRSQGFLVQQYELANEPIRLSINRARLADNGRWVDGITWDEIQRLKRECGYGDRYACELYPDDRDLVDVANVRHIWLLDEAPSFAWRRSQ